MEVTYKNKKREEQTIHTNEITIGLNADVDYSISINNFGELCITKYQSRMNLNS